MVPHETASALLRLDLANPKVISKSFLMIRTYTYPVNGLVGLCNSSSSAMILAKWSLSCQSVLLTL